MTAVLLIVLWLLAITLVFVLIVLGANRQLRQQQELLIEMLGEVNRELAEAQQQARLRMWRADADVVESYLRTI